MRPVRRPERFTVVNTLHRRGHVLNGALFALPTCGPDRVGALLVECLDLRVGVR
jgi:hypothetical protein